MLKYEKEIIEALLEKYQKRIIHEEGKNEVNREISVKPRNVYSKYGVNYDCDLLFNNAVDNLANKGFASAQKKEFSDDIEKIVLQKKNADQLIKYAFDTYDIIPINNHISNENELIKQYIEKGELTKFYCENTIVPKIQKSYKAFDVEEDQKVLKLLDFIQHNQKKLYIREVSMLVFGSSKVFESQYYQKACSIILSVNGKDEEDDVSNYLSKYNIIDVNQEILIKGSVQIRFTNRSIDISLFKEGISFMSSDIADIEDITINADSFMTIENKTAFHRMNDNNTVYMYLGGFANHHQENFLKKVYKYVGQNVQYLHFGDIDIGGFKIHKDLIDSTGIPFSLYKMSIEELNDEKYKNCLCELTDRDKDNAKSLLLVPEYKDIIEYMLNKNIKLEQEIIALYK